MTNIYKGNVVTEGSGRAIVALPDYFQGLNSDYRYQLTVIGQFAQAVAWCEVANGKFCRRLCLTFRRLRELEFCCS
jgi:hypothetical protein